MSNSCDPMDCRLPGSSVHGILQARILGWVAILFPRGSSRLGKGIQPGPPALQADSSSFEPPVEAHTTSDYISTSNSSCNFPHPQPQTFQCSLQASTRLYKNPVTTAQTTLFSFLFFLHMNSLKHSHPSLVTHNAPNFTPDSPSHPPFLRASQLVPRAVILFSPMTTLKSLHLTPILVCPRVAMTTPVSDLSLSIRSPPQQPSAHLARLIAMETGAVSPPTSW